MSTSQHDARANRHRDGRYMSIRDAARYLRVDEEVAMMAAWEGQLPAAQVRGRLMVDRRRLMQMLDPRPTPATER